VASASRIDSANVVNQSQTFSDWMGVARFLYRDQAREFHIGARHVGEKFRDELGYQDYAGVTYRRVGGQWDLFPKGSAFQRISPIADWLLVHDHTGRLELSQIDASQDFEFRRNAFLNLGYRHYDEFWIDRTFPQDEAHLFAQWTAWRPLALDLDATVGDGLNYETATLAWQERYTFNATARPTHQVTIAANVVRFRLADRPGGTDDFALWLVGVNATAQFTQRLALRVYPQYDGNSDHLNVNGLLSYVVHPGTVFYAGVNSGWDKDQLSDTNHATSRQFFTKASWRFSL